VHERNVNSRDINSKHTAIILAVGAALPMTIISATIRLSTVDLCAFSETFDTDFRPVMPDEKPSGVQSNSNRPAPYPYPTTAKYLQRPHGSYQYNDKHGQRRNHQGLLCEQTSTPFNLVVCKEFQSDEKLRFLACDNI